jgi:MEMO1 family protein
MTAPTADDTGGGQPEEAPYLGPADYAHACVDRFVRGLRPPTAPRDALYAGAAACFVSLKKYGDLRGCIGTLEPVESALSAEIPRNAYAAAFQDPRFPPVTEDELDALVCSVDVLSASEPCRLEELDPARYGVVVTAGLRRGVLLPALQGVDDAATQVDVARRKAGIAPGDHVGLERFTVVRYHEGDGPRSGAGGDA